MNEPVLILCPPRSFSSVAGTMLGQHPQLYGFPELSLFAAETLGELAALFMEHSPFRYPPGLLRTLAQLHAGEQSEKEVACAQTWLDGRQHWTTRRLFDYLLQRVAPNAGVDMSPQTAVTRGSLRRALAAYPQAKLLHLVRHPVTAVPSLQQHLLPGGCEPEHAAFYWLFVHRNILKMTRALPPERVRGIRGEELLARPEDGLAAIAAWLGVRADREAIQAMKHPERSPYARPGPPNAPLGNDPNFLRDPRLRLAELPASLRAPAEWEIHPPLWRRVVECARALGYAGAGDDR